ncbi:MAG: choice-of-anchor D domain-containing protein [Gloeocapsa sp. UFS-A4-WI-NPMV-4B04]|jgi:hypothetical protein|nr:choice-of-anchor D domain-containing protein [Gloeocapsa sp. UFS-A4-WI-NPMV-4B04]
MTKIHHKIETKKKIKVQRHFKDNSAIALRALLVLGGIFIVPSLSVDAKTDIYQAHSSQILLSQAVTTNTPNIAQSTKRLVFNDVQGGVASAARSVTLRNTGNANLTIESLRLSGIDANQFKITQQPTLPITLAAGSSTTVSIAFNPTTIGPLEALLQINSNDPDTPQATVSLRGLGTKGLGGQNEPSLQWILDTYQSPINVGDPNPADSSLSTTNPLGDEVSISQFQKAGTGPVTLEPIAVFAPKSSSGIVAKFGYYTSGNPASKTQLFTVPNASYQSLKPSISGTTRFDPGTRNFGFYSIWPLFNNRTIYNEDNLNTFSGAIPHHVRVYPLKNPNGTVVPNAYVLATEEHTSVFDYQDFAVIIRNVKPATTPTFQN